METSVHEQKQKQLYLTVKVNTSHKCKFMIKNILKFSNKTTPK